MNEEYRQMKCRHFLLRTITNENGCMIWQGSCVKPGSYGQAGILGKTVLVHRFIAFSLLLDGDDEREACEIYDVGHTCDEPQCINPEHLFIAPTRYNIYDSILKGRWASGERSPKAKLSNQDVVDIREAYNNRTSVKTLQKRYGVHSSTICRIVHNLRRV